MSTSSRTRVRRVDDQRLAGLPVADEVHEVHHLAGDRVVGGEVAAGEQLAEVEAVVGHAGWQRRAPTGQRREVSRCRPMPGPGRSRAGMTKRIEYRTCPLCEATCGLELHLDDDELTLVRGDKDDVFSHGYLCPKGTALKQLEADPDRLRTPQMRRGDTWHEVDLGRGVRRDRAGPRCRSSSSTAATRSAVYLGNPNAHNLGALIYNRVLLQALGTANVFSASTVDQMPKQVQLGADVRGRADRPGPRRRPHRLPADPRREPVRVERQPHDRARLPGPAARRCGPGAAGSWSSTRAARRRPRRPTSTSSSAPAPTRTSSSALVHTLVAEGLVHLGRAEGHVDGLDEVERLAADFAPEVVAPVCGIDADTIRRVARDLAATERAAVYGRIGTCTQEFGTLASWLVDVVNIARRQPRPRGRRDVHEARDRRTEHRRHARASGAG